MFLVVPWCSNFTDILSFFTQFFREIDGKGEIFFANFTENVPTISQSHSSVEKSSKTRSPFLRKNCHFFRQINVLTKEVTKELISRNFLSAIVFCSTTHWAIFTKKEKQELPNSISRDFFRNYYKKSSNCKLQSQK